MQISKRTGLNATDSRQSGNPIAWQAPDGHSRLLAMVHSRAHSLNYAHWLVRPVLRVRLLLLQLLLLNG